MNFATRSFISAVIAADLFAVVYFGGNYILHGSLFPHAAENKVIVAGAEDTGGKTEAKAAEPAFDPATYVANAENGMKIAAKCKACHTFDTGGGDRTGPNLWGIVGAPVTHKAGFAYSSAMVAKKADWGTWSKEHLNTYLEAPKDTVPGTKMQFNGIKKPAERADLIAWLETLK